MMWGCRVERRPVSVSRLVGLARPEVGLLGAATVALLIGSGLSLAAPQVVRWLVDMVVVDGDFSRLDEAALSLLGLFLVMAIAGMLRAWWFTVAGERVVARLRKDLFASILGQDIGFFDQTRTGELTNRLASDTTVLQNTVTVNVSMALRFVVSILGGLAMLLWTSPWLTLLSMLLVPVVAVGLALFGRAIRRVSGRVQDALADATDVAEQALSGVRTVRAFAAEGVEVDRYGEAVDRSYELAARRAFLYGGMQGIVAFAGYGSVAVVVWAGGRMVLDGQMSAGELTAFLIYTLMVAVSLGGMSGLYADFMKAIGSSERVFELMDLVAAVEGTAGASVSDVVGQVTFEGVHFAYPTRPDAVVLEDLELRIAPGEVVALVGPSGSGKSTIAALLLRLYAPLAGRIRVDDQDLAGVDLKAWRRHVGIVSQEPILFAGTIAENIRYGRPEASLAEVRHAAAVANALEFVEAFPDGLETLVGERGVRLSGGQKQRIAIARAVLLDPRVLVLDEATSALDAESEHVVQEALDRLMTGRTTLVIAHRLSTIRGADRVVVLHGGRVHEEGPHDALMAREGLYARLVERQFSS